MTAIPMDPFVHIEQLDQQSGHSATKRKDAGITYTPAPVAKAMVQLARPQENETIFEPSVGRGVFVFALVAYWLDLGKPLAWVDQWAQTHLFGVDLDAQAVEDLQQLWIQFFHTQGHTVARLNVEVEDGLFGQLAQRHYDLVLGNPPYVRIQHVDPDTRTALRAHYASCHKGNVDLYYAFLEHALTHGTRVCLITPNSWLSNDSAKTLRAQLLPRMTHLIDFGSRLIFAPVRAYTAIVMCETAVGEDIAVRTSLPDEPGTWQPIRRNHSSWDLKQFTPLAEEQVNENAGLGEQFDVYSGIATLADHAFLLPNPRVEGEYVYQADPLDANAEIKVPLALAPRLVKITKPGALDASGARILYPYGTDGKIINETDLQNVAPDLLAWLNRRRQILDGRDKGKTSKYEAWYAYGRRQGLWTATNYSEVVLLPQMGNGQLAPHWVQVKDIGPFLFTSGYVIAAKPGATVSLEDLNVYLKTAQAWAYVRKVGKAWAGKGEYKTIGARALRHMPLADTPNIV